MNFNEEAYWSIFPLLIFGIFIQLNFMYYAVTWQGRSKTPEVLERMHKSFIGLFFREYWYWFTEPVVKFFILIRFTPNMITGLAIVLSIVTGYYYFIGSISTAGILLVISGSMDLFDGRVARATGNSTKSGAYFDACVDRYSDAFVYIGIALYFLSRSIVNYSSESGAYNLYFYMVLVTIMLIVGTEVMSYVKARGEAMGYFTKSGLMQRPERVAFLSTFSVFDPYMRIVAERFNILPEMPFIVLIILMAILTNISAVIRFVSIFKDIKAKESLNE